jgi:glycosyltransferase involved in cell wall biosynthesis
VHIILFKKKEDDATKFTEKFIACRLEEFNYSQYDNYYLVLKRLNKIINKTKGIIVVNDGIELHAIKLFGTNSLVYSIVHDFYNLKLAFAYYNVVDVFICHTKTYWRALKSAGTAHPRIEYLPHGVKITDTVDMETVKTNEPLKIVFIGRLVASKGVESLYKIERKLKQKQINIEWKIIGSGELESFLKDEWKDSKNISFFKPVSNHETIGIAKQCDIFISPSVFEGYGIALLEAMACGLVPIIYDLPVGIASVLPADAGFKIDMESGIDNFVERIQQLDNDRSLLMQMKKNAHQFAAEEYDIAKTAKSYLQIFLNKDLVSPNAANKNKQKKINSFGLFDKWFIPNSITVKLKQVKTWIRKTS